MAIINREALEAEADEILSDFLKNPKKNKMSLMEYPFLSVSQMERRARMEIPFSSLSLGQVIGARSRRLDLSDPSEK